MRSVLPAIILVIVALFVVATRETRELHTENGALVPDTHVAYEQPASLPDAPVLDSTRVVETLPEAPLPVETESTDTAPLLAEIAKLRREAEIAEATNEAYAQWLSTPEADDTTKEERAAVLGTLSMVPVPYLLPGEGAWILDRVRLDDYQALEDEFVVFMGAARLSAALTPEQFARLYARMPDEVRAVLR